MNEEPNQWRNRIRIFCATNQGQTVSRGPSKSLHNLDVSVGVLKGHGFLSVLYLLHEGFKLCFSADLALHLLVNFIYVLACESPVFDVEVSKQSKAYYSCVCRVFFLECAIVHFRH